MKRTCFLALMVVVSNVFGQSNNASTSENAKVIVIGAGAAGLYAGKILKEYNIDFTILEADDRIGGRLKKNDTFTDFPLDMGAEWIHGHKSLTYKLAIEKGVAIEKDKTEYKILYNNKRYDLDNPPAHLKPITRYIGGGAFFGRDETLLSWARRKGYGPEYNNFLAAAINDTGGSPTYLSSRKNITEFRKWYSGKNDHKFKNQTYYDLIYDHVASDIENKVVLNAPVSKVDYRGDKILVTAGGKNYEADRVIVTVSVNVLKSNLIEFIPALNDSKTQAINKIGMEAGMKVYLKFDRNFFTDEAIIGTAVSPMYYDAGHGKSSKQPTLGLFITGYKAQALSDLSEEAAIQSIIDELDIIYEGQASKYYTGKYVIQDWKKEPYVLGAYSYSTVDIGKSRKILAQPIDDKIFFAGEASHFNGHFQTVQGALETGEREALKVVDSF